MAMRVGVVILPDLPWATALGRWQAAETRGFSSAWSYDHLSWRSLRDGPWFGALPLLAGVAASTTTIRIGTLVTSPNFRHPALLAKDAMTLDHISSGRFDLGVGAGGTGFDAHVLGEPPPSVAERAARFEGFTDALDVLLRQPMVSYTGPHYTVVESRTVPGCVQQPRVPFTVAAAGPRALAVAARHGDSWVTFGPMVGEDTPTTWYAAVTGQIRSLETACGQLGRDPGSIGRTAMVSLDLAWPQASIGAWDDFCGRLDILGFTEVLLHWPRPDDPLLPGPPPALFDEISSRLA